MAFSIRSAGSSSRSRFDPRKIADLALWLDASDSATLFDATTGGSTPAADGGVARWEDKSGNGRHFTQGTANNRPVLKSGVQNSRAGLRFDSTDDAMSSSAFNNTLAMTLFVVNKLESSTPGDYKRIIELGQNNGWCIIDPGGATKYGIQYVLDGGNSANDLTTNASLLQLFCDGASPRSVSFKLNANAVDSFSFSGTPTTSLAMHINKYGSGGYHIGQDVFEVVYYARLLSDSERSSVATYLTSKWGI